MTAACRRSPNTATPQSSKHSQVRYGSNSVIRNYRLNVRFSNRPFRVKHFQTVHLCGVDVARRLALLFGIGTRALPSWDSKIRWNNL
jgi:hypothetical protein